MKNRVCSHLLSAGVFVAIPFLLSTLWQPLAYAQNGGPSREWRQKSSRRAGASGIEQRDLVEMGTQLRSWVDSGPAPQKATASPPPLRQLLARRQQNPRHLGSAKAAPPPRAAWHMHWNTDNGTPTFIDNPAPVPSAKLSGAGAPAERALDFIRAHRDLFHLRDPGAELSVLEATSDAAGKHHIKFQQQHRGIPIWGHQLVVHLQPGGTLYALNARYGPTPRSFNPAAPILQPGDAIRVASNHLELTTPIRTLGTRLKKLLHYPGPAAKRYIWVDEKTRRHHLVWHVTIRPNLRDRWYYFIDAHSGRILEYYNATASEGPTIASGLDLMGNSQTLNVYEADGLFLMLDASRSIFSSVQPDLLGNPQGALITLDAGAEDLQRDTHLFYASSADDSWEDPIAVSAHSNTGKIFDYFSEVHDRRGLDDRGGSMISVVHVTYEGEPMGNAFWNGAVIAYGDGNSILDPLAKSLDVAAHEMTHGIIERTVNLEYRFESGALNESLADVFAAMVDRDDWLIGEDVVNTSVFPSGALRDLAAPHNGGTPDNFFWQPAHMDEFRELDITEDNGGVHTNSGIPNRACFLLAEAIGREKTEQIYYRIMAARYLNSRANFVDMRLAAERAAGDLFGTGSSEVDAVRTAFEAVGIIGATGLEAPPDLLPVDGEQWIAVVNATEADNSLFLVRPEVRTDADIKQLTPTQVYTRTGNPISISDDGTLIIFVDDQNCVRVINSNGTNERTISNDCVWRSVALSPDKRRLAATTDFFDDQLFIIDLIEPAASKVVNLYNPTTQEGVVTSVTRFADALDWDLSSQFVVYDAYNSTSAEDAVALAYWDVNILDVDNEIIFPLFPPQPQNISMGNPSFAQTSDNFIVFDLIDLEQELDEIWAVDLFSGAASLIESNGSSLFGYPRYSPDDSHLVFQRMDGEVATLRQIPLADNKIQASGPSQDYLREGQRPSWFAMGERAPLPTSVEGEGKGDTRPLAYRLLPNYPNPFNPETTIRYTLAHEGNTCLKVYDIQGRLVVLLESAFKQAGAYSVHWNGLDNNGRPAASGVYFSRLEITGAAGKVTRLSQKMTLLR